MGLYCPNIGKLDILVCNLLIINSVQKCPVSDKNPVTDKKCPKSNNLAQILDSVE